MPAYQKENLRDKEGDILRRKRLGLPWSYLRIVPKFLAIS
jgi:hypothetical protein